MMEDLERGLQLFADDLVEKPSCFGLTGTEVL